MPEQSIRFGIINNSDERSATWKCIIPKGVNKNDVYIMQRHLGGAIKTSLHESGNWHVAHIHNYFQEHMRIEDINEKGRFIEKWNRPIEIAPGITLALRIITPWSAVKTKFDKDNFKKAIWIPNAPKDRATEIYLLLTRPHINNDGWPGKSSMNTKLIGSMELDGGETVWLVYSYIKIPKINLDNQSWKYYKGKSKTNLYSNDLRILIFGDHPDGSKFMYDSVVEPMNHS